MSKLDAMRDLFGIAQAAQGMQERQLAPERQAERDHLQYVRSLSLGYVNLIQNAPNAAARKVYVEMAEGITKGLPQKDLDALKHIYKGTPLGTEERKEKEFLKYNGPRPTVEGLDTSNETLVAQRVFQGLEWDKTHALAMTGHAVPPPRAVGGNAGNVYVKRKNGAISILSSDQFNAESTFGTSAAEFVLNDGKSYGEPQQIVSGGRLYNRRTVMDLINREKLPDEMTLDKAEVAAERTAAASVHKYDRATVTAQQNVIAAFGANDLTNNYVKSFHRLVEKEGMDPDDWADESVAVLFPGKVVRVVNVEEARFPSWGTDYNLEGKWRLMAVDGVPFDHPLTGEKMVYQPPTPDKDGKILNGEFKEMDLGGLTAEQWLRGESPAGRERAEQPETQGPVGSGKVYSGEQGSYTSTPSASQYAKANAEILATFQPLLDGTLAVAEVTADFARYELGQFKGALLAYVEQQRITREQLSR